VDNKGDWRIRRGEGLKRWIVWISVFIPGLFYLLEFMFSGTPISFEGLAASVGNLAIVIGAFAVGVGIINIFSVHGRRISRREKGWFNSIIMFATFALVLGLSMIGEITGGNPLQFYITYVAMPLVATVMSLLGFYITYAAYRAFKFTSTEAGVMMLVALICMLGHDPLGNALTSFLERTSFHFLRFPILAQFMMNFMNGAVFRALEIGIGISAIAMSIRVLLGLEKGLTEGARDEGP
jgi:hypothetical protein